MQSRERIIEAAARVYAQHGFRGATTRRIAEEAGVNEITIFRQFGSKAALIDEVVRSHSAPGPDAAHLPEVPVHPEHELVRWVGAQLAHLRARRALIRKTMAELEERPESAECAGANAMRTASELRRYMRALRQHGFLAPAGEGDVDPYAAGAMLMAVVFSDAMGREMMPELYPRPAEQAAAKYVRVFLRAIHLRAAAGRAAAAKRGRAPARPHPSSSSRS